MASNKRWARLGFVLILLASSCGTGSSDGPASSVESPEMGTDRSTPPGAPRSRGSRDKWIVRALIRFARSPGPETVAAVPLADDGVWLGLADRLLVRRSPEELKEPRAWVLQAEHFRAYVGPFSALDLLARTEKTTVSLGPHPHCASPPMPAPKRVSDLRRVSVQPRDSESCLQWWTVDLFVMPGAEIKAVTLDLWEP